MPHQNAATAVVYKASQSLVATMARPFSINFQHRVGITAYGGRQLFVGLEQHVERLAHHLALPHTDGGNLDNVVGVGVEAGGLGVEYYQLLVVVGSDKLLQVGRFGE